MELAHDVFETITKVVVDFENETNEFTTVENIVDRIKVTG